MTTVYCWGNTAHGELGLGGIEDEQIMVPREMDWIEAKDLVQVSCGSLHTLLLTRLGKVYSCGNNDYGQLGHEFPRKRPQFIQSLENYLITQVSCGASHSLAINNWGQIFTWGSNLFGQLGLDLEIATQPTPKIVKTLATKHIVQIACGQYHNLALTNSGDLYSWGANSYGQLGQGYMNEKIATPTIIKSLAGIPIAFIACGGNHSFAVSTSGAVFTWGKNTCGQLGLNDAVNRQYPTQLKTLRSLGVRFISCGEDFTVFLTQEGGVFTCGAGTSGQLGHGVSSNEILPRMVVELMGSTITQISCGRRHTLAYVPSRGKVYGFGLGGSGQLGNGTPSNSSTPQMVRGPWIAPFDDDNNAKRMEFENENLLVRRIFSGGDQCFAALVKRTNDALSDDLRLYDNGSQILQFTVDMGQTMSSMDPKEQVDLDLLSAVETVFKSQACFNASLLKKNDEHFCCTSRHHGVDIEAAEKAFEFVRKIEHETLKHLIWESISNDLLSTLMPSPPDVETLRIYLILPLYHEFINSKNFQKLQMPFIKAVLSLTKVPTNIISQWWASQTKDYFERLLDNYKHVLMYIIHKLPKFTMPGDDKPTFRYEANVESILTFLLMLYRINHNHRVEKVPYECFHMPELCEIYDMRVDYVRWLTDKSSNAFFFCNYPFIFDAPAKMLLLQTDQGIQMHQAMQNAATQGIFAALFNGGVATASQFIVLNVTRENIVQDTLRELANYGQSDLKKPLKVKFHGEEAEDAGGVRKEFFMLLLRDLINPKYGMFKTYEDSRAIWFHEEPFEDEGMFDLVGTLVGLAIYNFTIINVPFPLALYKKLLNEPVDLSDLKDVSPIVGNSMQSILNYDGEDFSDVFDLTFEISTEVFGEVKQVPLKDNGDKVKITQENKKEFVDLYIDYIFNKSVRKWFSCFQRGFMKVCGGRVMELFKSYELMAVVIGNEEYDWHALEENAEYKNGYKSSDESIRWFWEVFHELPLEEKKKFLLFLTGSDRIPITGMKEIKIYIQPTTDEKFLPVAHTCFNLLDLPQYKTKERLKYKLLQAIQQTQGFSLV